MFHGTVIYALTDHAFSAVCNAYGKTSVGLSTTIQFIEAAKPGDRIIARATEVAIVFVSTRSLPRYGTFFKKISPDVTPKAEKNASSPATNSTIFDRKLRTTLEY
ncbi:PaaI family thioesterase [Bacillus pakistanensis]|uniref:PaaI family thioesterase n=1 Tax=Rossellomorea pakistanensis TaxID=992288 RepID=UPI001EF92FE7|nr:hotdog domain-containing protein [Bacillus pakistanensis]